MELSRTKKAKLNIIISLLSQGVTLVCGLIVPRLMLGAFGSEANGAVASITQFLGYIALLEGGVGGIARAALFKPLAEKDKIGIAKVYNEVHHFFKIIAIVFSAYVLVIACSFNKISHTEVFDWGSSFLLVIILSLSTFAQYFIGITNSILLQASQKVYITTSVSIVGTILNAILTVVLINFGCSLHIVKLASSIVFILKPIALWIYVKKDYNLPKLKVRDKEALSQKWTGLGQHLAFTFHSHTDVVVLTIFKTLTTVSIYSVYSMVITNVQNVVASFSTGLEALLGDMYAKKEYDKMQSTFSKYETLIALISNTLFSTCAIMIVPFIILYTSNVNDANYVAPLFSVLLIMASLVTVWRAPYTSAVNAAGHYYQTRFGAYGEAITNVVSSIILVIKFGLVGVAIGTILGTLFRFVFYAIYLSKNIVNRNIFLFIKRTVINLVNFFAIYIPGYLIVKGIAIDNFFIWAVCGMISVIFAAVVTFIVQIIFYRQDTFDIVKMLFGKIKR